MSHADIVETLGALALFQGLAADSVAALAAASRLHSLQRGERVVHEGEPCRGLFAVRKGGVRLFRIAPDGKEQILHRVGPGRTFAEAALLTMSCYPAHAEATETPTEVLEIGGDVFLRMFEEDRRLARGMVASLSSWLHRMVERVEELSVLSAGARLARYLLDLPAAGEDGRATVELPVPKKELAAYLGITPETLSRLLRKWQDRELVESTRRTVVILDFDTLMTLAED